MGMKVLPIHIYLDTLYTLYPAVAVANGVTAAARPALSNEDATRNLQLPPAGLARATGRPRGRACAKHRPPTLPLSSSSSFATQPFPLRRICLRVRRNNIRLISKLKTTIIYCVWVCWSGAGVSFGYGCCTPFRRVSQRSRTYTTAV